MLLMRNDIPSDPGVPATFEPRKLESDRGVAMFNTPDESKTRSAAEKQQEANLKYKRTFI